jgi:hypothetical protein
MCVYVSYDCKYDVLPFMPFISFCCVVGEKMDGLAKASMFGSRAFPFDMHGGNPVC